MRDRTFFGLGLAGVIGLWIFGIALNFAFWGGLIYLVYRLFFKH